MKYAVPLADLEVVWKTPAGAALVEASLQDDADGDAAMVTLHGQDCVVLGGPAPRIAALVGGLLALRVGTRPVVVWGGDENGWRRVHRPPRVAELPDDPPGFDDPEGEEVLLHA